MSDLDYRAGTPSDPGAGFGGVAPRPQALARRLIGWLAFTVLCAAGGIAAVLSDVPSAAVVLTILFLIGLIGVAVVWNRRRRRTA